MTECKCLILKCGKKRCNGTVGNNGGECYGDCKLTLLDLESRARGGCTKTKFGSTIGGAN